MYARRDAEIGWIALKSGGQRVDDTSRIMDYIHAEMLMPYLSVSEKLIYLKILEHGVWSDGERAASPVVRLKMAYFK